MSRLTPLLPTAAVVLLMAACGNTPTDPSTQLKRSPTANSADTTAAQPQAENENETEITLTASADFPGARGRAEFESEDSERELEIRVDRLDALAGTTVGFFLGGVSIGTRMVSGDGEARLELESEHGGTVPMSVAGQTVEVRTAAGVVIVSGTF